MPESIAGEAKVFLDQDKKLTIELKLQNDFTLTWQAPQALPWRTPFVLAHDGKLTRDALSGTGLIHSLEAILSSFIDGRAKLSDETRQAITKQLESGKVIEFKNHRKGVKSWQS
jgi:hypothetical protein